MSITRLTVVASTTLKAAAIIVAMVLSAPSVARAEVTVTIRQVGNDVVATGSGSLNLTALNFISNNPATAAFIRPQFGAGTTGTALFGATSTYRRYGDFGQVVGPTSFGIGNITTPATSSTGDTVGIRGQASTGIFISQASLANVNNLSFTTTWANKTIAGLGITPGTYTWTWGSGPTADSFTLTTVSNEAPTANAGENQTIRAGDTVYLDGSASFDDNTPSAMLEYAWEFTSRPEGSNAALNNSSSVMPTFVADVAGTYELAVVVTDEDGVDSEPALVSISSSNLAPTAVATVDFALAVVGTTSFFDGSGSSDPELDEIAYFWEITAAPLGSTAVLVDAGTATPSLTTDVEGTYEVTLTVSDFLGPGAPTSVEFVATTPQNYAEVKILEASDLLQALLPAQVTSIGNQNALGKFLKNATKDLQKGNVSKALDDLNKALERTDGCALRGSPDGNGAGRDWVIDCDAQHDIYDALKLAIDLLATVE